MRTKSVVLIDFENLFYKRRLTDTLLVETFRDLMKTVVKMSDNLNSIEIRLYDGWRHEMQNTQKADQVMSLLYQIEGELFPSIIAGRKMAGSIELAFSQYGIDHEWENTMNLKKGVHRLSIDDSCRDSSHCNDTSHCPIHMISKASKGEDVTCPIDGCGAVSFDRLVRNEQKMVDTMMGCDMLEYILDEEYGLVAVMSDDIDMLPPLLLSGKHKPQDSVLCYFTKNKKNKERYEPLLSNYQIITKLWQ